ncbi:MAG: PHP domain-containing protein [Gemmatimonadaceae bacterium]|nr:PHP domain-containing protein [Gemmatimonadaceae bacterium]
MPISSALRRFATHAPAASRAHLVRALFLLSVAAVSASAQPARFEVPTIAANARWLKGNTHTHTTNSDGDTPPTTVAKWYKDHGYHFLVLTDHNVFTDPATLASLVDSSFALLPGEEVTTSFERKAVHVNALGVTRVIPPLKDSTLLGTVQKTIDAIRTEGAVPHINHPNFLWSIDSATLFRVRNDKLFEIFNGHPTVHNIGGGDWPGMEEVWDGMLSGGKRIYGIAVDDAHHFQGEFAPNRANPGRGWVTVRAPQLNTASVMTALETGQFYASSGVSLTDVVVTTNTLTITIAPKGDFKFTTEFIGQDGKVLAVDKSMTPAYRLKGTERYVRAKITDSGGGAAWVQPVFTSRFVERAP